MKYMIVRNEKYRETVDSSLKQIEDKVNNLIKEGWRPFGSLEMIGDTYGQYLLQAMVLEDKAEELQKITTQVKKETVSKMEGMLKAEHAKKRRKKK